MRWTIAIGVVLALSILAAAQMPLSQAYQRLSEKQEARRRAAEAATTQPALRADLDALIGVISELQLEVRQLRRDVDELKGVPSVGGSDRTSGSADYNSSGASGGSATGGGASDSGGGNSGGYGADRSVHVHGYERSNGTSVAPYDRAAPGQGTGRSSGGRR